MTARQTITDAKANLIVATALRDVWLEELDAAFPEPTEDSEWDAWNDAYEDAYCNRGGYDLDSNVRAAQDQLLSDVRAHMLTVAKTAESTAAVVLVFDGALGKGKPNHYVACRTKAIAMSIKLDTAGI